MKKYVIAGILVAAIATYIIFANRNAAPAVSDANTPTATPGEGTSTAGGSGTGAVGGYKDGTYTGPVTDAVYGQIQVVVTVAGGKITGVDVPVYPNAPGHTSDVTATAIPALKQEALTVQSANVDIVSGATQDSEAFQQSLAAALAQAKA